MELVFNPILGINEERNDNYDTPEYPTVQDEIQNLSNKIKKLQQQDTGGSAGTLRIDGGTPTTVSTYNLHINGGVV